MKNGHVDISLFLTKDFQISRDDYDKQKGLNNKMYEETFTPDRITKT